MHTIGMPLHQEQLEEASIKLVEQKTSYHGLTLLGFSGLQKHYEVEEMLTQVG